MARSRRTKKETPLIERTRVRLAPAPSELLPYDPIAPGAFLAVLAKLRERVPGEIGKGKDPAGG
jgi:hypothetical protein